MYIKRHCENTLKRLALNYSSVIVTGPRQIGKTTLLKEMLSDIKYVTLDDLRVLSSAKDETSLFFDVYKPPVIVDEIQYAPDLFHYVKIIADEKHEKGLFYMTGSQSFHLMKNVSESLAGRVGLLQMLGLSLREIKCIDYFESFLPDSKHIESMKKLSEKPNYWDIINIIHKGSFPALYESEKTEKDWRDFYTGYLRTYIERDVRALTQVTDESAFLKFIKATAALTGQQLNYSKIAEIVGKDITTVQRWLSILITSGLVYLLQPYYNNFNKRLIKTPKLYFLDTGLACYLTGWNNPEQLANGAMLGPIFETFVLSEILKSYYNDGNINPPLYYYRDKDTNEIDLIVENGINLYPIEIKATGNPNKNDISNFALLDKINGKTRAEGGIICMADTSLYLTKTDRIIPVTYI